MRAPTHDTEAASPKGAEPRGGATLTPPRSAGSFVARLSGAPLQAKLSAAARELRAAQADAAAPMQLPAPSGGGAPLDAAIREPMEAAFGASFEEVRVHHDGAAEALGALAFTRGRDIHFAAGAFAPRSHAGLALLGHELAHVQQQRAGRVAATQGDGAIHHDVALEAEADRLGALAAAGEPALVSGAEGGSLASDGGPVQAKLGWTRETLEKRSALEGKGDKSRSWIWQRMLKLLDKYNEKATDSVEDIPHLQRLQDACIAWLERHDDELGYLYNENKRQSSETLRGTVERLAYADIPNEMGSLRSGLREGTFVKRLTGGQVASTSLVNFNGETRVFKQEATNYGESTASKTTGIVESIAQHPLYGSRAVASWRVDQLIGANILTRMEFAQRTNSKKQRVGGTVAKLASGGALKEDNKLVINDIGMNVNFSTYDEVNYDTPALQRQLSTLQILDAITGQADRHASNFFVDLESPNSDVAGIDNDLSFGEKRNRVCEPMGGDDRFRGIPPYVDRGVGQRILALSESRLREELRTLLPPKAIKATLERLRLVKKALKKMEKAGRLLAPNQWNTETSRAHTSENSYLGTTRMWAGRAKERALLIPHGGDVTTKGRETRRERFTALRKKLAIFESNPQMVADRLRSGASVAGLSATSLPELATELREAITALKLEFPGIGGESYFDTIEKLIKENL